MLGWLYLTRFGAIKTQRQATGKQLSRRGIRLPVLRLDRKVMLAMSLPLQLMRRISRSVSVRTTTQLHQLPEVVPRIVLVSSTVRRLMITAVVSHSTTLVMKLMDPNLRRKAKMMKGKGMAQTKNRRTTACTKGPQMTLFRFCATLTVIRNFDSTTSMRLIRILRAHKAGLSLIRTAKAMKTRQTRMETTPGTGTDECKPEIIHRELPRVADLMNDVIGIY
ncbi:hypothetical protein JG687_00007357 [Phytophthora cactorum]|uniref:Uncharacterized protein n=1 Tax=Phytophthora cactorum TaxID=29920 RepID=A0A329RX18_9STRA|nr:hypothetical protein JG687_00007357 [Phytophthora cactorum]RAW27952.1 hypothetical protein PC110_g15648 [Phytophthora cactorum]